MSQFESKWPLAPEVINYIARRCRTEEEEACLKLQRTLLDGSVRARGPLRSASAEAIDNEYWRFALPDTDGSAVNLSTFQKLPWFEVAAEDVLQVWPIEPAINSKTVSADAVAKSGNVSRRRGPRPLKREEVIGAMRLDRANGFDLAGAKEIELEDRYGASRDTCRQARDALLNENSDN